MRLTERATRDCHSIQRVCGRRAGNTATAISQRSCLRWRHGCGGADDSDGNKKHFGLRRHGVIVAATATAADVMMSFAA